MEFNFDSYWRLLSKRWGAEHQKHLTKALWRAVGVRSIRWSNDAMPESPAWGAALYAPAVFGFQWQTHFQQR